MTKRVLLRFILSVVLLLPSGFIFADEQEQSQQNVQTQEQIYGSQLMTKQERAEHREKIRAAKTKQEREQIRKEHHERMKERARARGINLPDEPPVRSGGMGHRGGRMGPGSGMGPGGGKR